MSVSPDAPASKPAGFCIRFDRSTPATDAATPRIRKRTGFFGREAMKRRTVLAGLGASAAAGVIAMPSILKAQAPISLNGAVQFNDDHAFNRALLRFEDLVQKYY